jgi:NAD(P)-dependent dehydrogenase (short-subunit alcohol dehydrogenase family)
MGGFSLACASIECLTRTLAGEVGRYGVRVVALRPNFTPETHPEWVNLDDDSLKPLPQLHAARLSPPDRPDRSPRRRSKSAGSCSQGCTPT